VGLDGARWVKVGGAIGARWGYVGYSQQQVGVGGSCLKREWSADSKMVR
jgi:hypothetical protein